jgi:hypothetical protein
LYHRVEPRSLIVSVLVALLVAGCSPGVGHPHLPATGSAMTAKQAGALALGSTLWVAGTLVTKSTDRWCIRDIAATICAAPSPHLQGERMPAAFRTGVRVHGQLTGRTPAATWTAIVMHVG